MRGSRFCGCEGGRGQPNRGYKKPNPNPNILSTIFGSYNRGRIVQKGIRFIRNRGRIVQKGIRFIRNRIDDLNRIIRLSRISGFCSRILTELFGWTEYWVISFKYQQARLANKDTSYVCNPRVQKQTKPSNMFKTLVNHVLDCKSWIWFEMTGM